MREGTRGAGEHCTYVLMATTGIGESMALGVWYDLDSAVTAQHKAIFVLDELGMSKAIRLTLKTVRSNSEAFSDFETHMRALSEYMYGRFGS